MKKMLSALSLALLLSLVFSLPALASTDGNEALQIQFSEFAFVDTAETDESNLLSRQPALPVTDIRIVNPRILPNGTVEVTVWIQGQGQFLNHWSTLGTSRHVRTDFGSGWAPVRDFFHVFEIGPARVGSHMFEFTVRCLRNGTLHSNLRWHFTIG